MRIRSVNVSLGRSIVDRGRAVLTGIFKEPTTAPVTVRPLGLDGDKQFDKKFHGGEDKAVYSYAWEHYAWWREQRSDIGGPGAFGENLTTEDLDEADVCVGDHLSFGGVVLQANEPRLPCNTLAARYKDPRIVKRFCDGARWGVYYRVVEPGILRVGDEIAWVSRETARVPIAALAALEVGHGDLAMARSALTLASLSAGWRRKLEKILAAG